MINQSCLEIQFKNQSLEIWIFEVLGKLGPGQLGPGPNCPPLKNGQLGPGQLGPRQLGPDSWAPDSCMFFEADNWASDKTRFYFPWTQKLPRVFGTNIRIKSRMLNCTHILENVPSPCWAQRQQPNLIIPPNLRHKNQDRIKNVELYTHFWNYTLPPWNNNPTW